MSTLLVSEIQKEYQRAPLGMTDPAKYRSDTMSQKMTSQAWSICTKVQISNLVYYLGAMMKARVAVKEKCD